MPKLKVKKGDPVKATVTEISRVKTPIDNDANLRDKISLMLADNAGTQDAGKYLKDIAFSIGETDATGALKNPDAAYDKARKIVDKVVLYNQSPEGRNPDAKSKIGTFFDVHSKASDVGDILSRLRNMGQGVEANYTDSPLTGLGKFPREKPVPSNNNNIAITDMVTDRINTARKPVKIRVKK